MRKLFLSVLCAVFALVSWGQNFPFPQNATYSYGIKATTPDVTKIQSLYTTWKNNHYESGTGADAAYARIKYDNTSETVSEGIGYGMLIFVYMENATNSTQDEFNKLYAYYKKFGRFSGYLMQWKTSGFSTVVEAGSATDGDLDVALALLLAHKQWGSTGTVNYIQEAENLIDMIWQKQIIQSNYLIKPGDHWDNAMNPCYFTTATIKLFDVVQTQEGFSKTHTWSNVYNTAQTYLTNSQSSVGLWADWTSASVTSPTNCKPAAAGGGGCDFSWDACRTPWRVAWDYAWWGTTSAKTMCEKTITLADTKTSGSFYAPLNVSTGNQLSSGVYNNSVFIGGLGSSYMVNATKQSTLDTWYSTLKNKNESLYYAPTLQILYLLTLSGNTPNFYENSAPTAPKFISAETNGAGTSIYITTNKTLKTPSVSEINNFSLKINNTTIPSAFTSISLLSSSVISLQLSASAVIVGGDNITISYTPGNIQSTDNLTFETFANKPVLNKLASNNTLIADCENGSETSLLTFWYSYKAGASTIAPLSSATVPFTMTVGGANGTDSAAVANGQLVNPEAPATPGGPGYESCGIGFAFTGTDPILNASKMVTNEASVIYDLTGATGISFWHKGDAVNFSIICSNTQQEEGHDFNYAVPTHANWTLVEVPFTSALQESWVTPKATWDPSKVMKLQWQVKGGIARAYTFSIDEVVVMGKVLNLPSQGVVDKTALDAEIISATALHTAAIEGTATGQYPIGSKAILMTAINTASTVNLDAAATQTEVDAALSNLQATVATFEASIIGVTVDKTLLASSISTAQTVRNGATEGTAVGNYPVGSKTTLLNAITAAQTVNNNASATQTQVNNAKTTLDAAVAAFQASVITSVSSNTLIADCEAANETKLLTYWYSYKAGASSISPLSSATIPFTMTLGGANGTDSAAVANGQLVNTGAPDYESCGIGFAFTGTDPILNASKMVTNEASVIYDLTGATGISFWHKGDAVNFSIICSNTQQEEGHDFNYAVSSHANWTLVEVPFTSIAQESWVTPQATWDPSKVMKLQWQVKGGVARSYSFGIDEVIVMGKVLNLPSQGVVDKTDLDAEITSATTLHTAAVEGSATGQYPSGSKAILLTAINSATTVNLDATATQTEVDAALANLQAAVATFEASVIGITVDKTLLASSITTAQTVHNGATEGTAVGNYPVGSKTTLLNAISAAQTVNNNASATQTQVNNAKTSLDAAVATFQASVITSVSSNTLIADCEAANETKLLTYWYSYKAGASTIVPLSSATVPFTMTLGGANGTDSAAVANGQLVNPEAPATSGGPGYESCGIGFAFTGTDPILNASKMVTNEASVIYDLTGATGISFWHKGDAVNFSIICSNTQQEEGHDFNYAVSSHANWTLVEVPFTSIAQESWVTPQATWDPSKVMKLQWQVKGGVARSYSFGIDEVIVMGKVLNLPTQTVVDKTALASKITEANTTLSVNNSKIKTIPGVGEFPLSAGMALQDAVTAANLVNTNASATQTQVDNATTTLNTAILTFLASEVTSVAVDKTLLASSITTAQTVYSGATEGTAVGNYPVGSKTTLLNAISAAQTVNNNASATQTQVNNAKTTLDAAVATFQASVITNTVSKTALQTSIATGNNVYINSTEGTAVGQYPSGSRSTLLVAINTAQAVNINTNATQTEVNNAKATLDAAIVTFQNSQITSVVVNKSSLVSAISNATGIHNSSVEGTANGQYPIGSKTTLMNAITVAQGVNNNTSATQQEVNTAVTTLNNALTFFLNSVNGINTATLQDKIDQATLTLLLATNNTGNEPGNYPFSSVTTLNSAITAAQNILATATTQVEITNAVNSLQNEITSFTNSVVPYPIDITVLQALIDIAENTIETAEIGTQIGQYPASTFNALYTELITANTLMLSTNITQNEIDTEVVLLQNIYNSFIASVRTDIDTKDAQALELNVTQQTITIESSEVISQVLVTTVLGSKTSILVHATQANISIAHIAKGVYFVTIEFANGSVETIRMIKK